MTRAPAPASMRFAVGLLALALLLVLPMAAQAQLVETDKPTDSLQGDIVWETPHVLAQNTVLENNSTLTIRGTTLDIGNTTFQVREGGHIIVESDGDVPGVLKSDLGGWIRVLGKMDLRGTTGTPVEVYGLGGVGSTLQLFQEGGSVNIQRGLGIVKASLDAEHVRFVNYTSGILAGGTPDGKNITHVNLTDVEFNSHYGDGFISTNAEVHMRDVRFVDAGANAFFSISSAPAELTNVSFTNSTTALAVRDTTMNVTDLNVTDSKACLIVQAGGWTNLSIHRFTCKGVQHLGVLLSHPTTSIQTPGRVAIEDASFDANKTVTEPAITVRGNETVELRNVTIGPTPPGIDGIDLTQRNDTLENVTFQGIGGYDVTLISPPSTPNATRLGNGAPGTFGWLRVVQPTTIHVTDVQSSQIVSNAFLTVQETGAKKLGYARTMPGTSVALNLDALRVDPAGNVTRPTYTIVATKDNLTGNRTGYVPGPPILIVRLNGTPVSSPTPTSTTPATSPGEAPRKVPLPALLPLAGVAAALLLRRRVS